MSAEISLQAASRRILEDAGRPLNARKLLQLGERTGAFGEASPTMDVLRAALADAEGVSEVRRGVFTIRGPDDPPAPAPKPARAPAPRAEEPEGLPKRRRRRTRTRDRLGAQPSAPVSMEDAAQEAGDALDRESLRRGLWERARSAAEALVGDDAAEREDLEEDHYEAPATAEPEPLAPESPPSERVVSEPAAPAPPPVVRAELASDPYRENRAEAEGPPDEGERRNPALAEIVATDTLVESAIAALRQAEQPLSLGEIGRRVDRGAKPGTGLKAALRSENARRAANGLRAPFVIHYDGRVALSEWGMSERFRELEAQIHEALAEQREILRRELLSRVAGLGDLAFEQVLVMLLEQQGYDTVKVVHRQPGGNLALVATRGDETLAALARRAWSETGVGTVQTMCASLPTFGARRAVILTVGTFSDEAIEAASTQPVELVDGRGLAARLHTAGVGIASHRPACQYLDLAFFESLE
jgi:hypothetical protein